VLLGAGLIGLGVYAMNIGAVKLLIDIPWPIGVITVGAFIFIIAFFGCCGAWKESRLLLGLYFIFLFLIVASQIFIVVYSWKFDSNGKLDSLLSEGWGKADNSLKQSIQNTFNCCGFQNADDKASPPCPKNVTIGCKVTLLNFLDDHFKVVKIALIVIASIQFVGLFFSLWLMCAIRPEERRIRENQDYTNWNYGSAKKYTRIA